MFGGTSFFTLNHLTNSCVDIRVTIEGPFPRATYCRFGFVASIYTSHVVSLLDKSPSLPPTLLVIADIGSHILWCTPSGTSVALLRPLLVFECMLPRNTKVTSLVIG